MYTITPLLSSDLVSTSRVTINNNFNGLATDIAALSAAGVSGYSGYSGVGISGYSGQVGTSGYSGLNGANAASGYSGASGISGYSGASGYYGQDGTSGYSGASGISGYSGASGYYGQDGTSGYSGASGYSGISGYQGEPGVSGFAGADGDSGYSGISGYSGASGYSGISGYSGAVGTSGYSGNSTSGYSGVSGYSGYSGPGADQTLNTTSNVAFQSLSATSITVNGQPTMYGMVNPDFIQAGRITSDQTSMGVNSDIIFNAWVNRNGTTLDTSTGIFTLTAGKTYRLFAGLSFSNFSSDVGWIQYEWVDATTNTRLDTSGSSVGIGEAINRDTNEFNATSSDLIYSPSTNQTVKVRITAGSGTVTVRNAIGTKATIEQLNPTLALNTLDTMTVTNAVSAGGNVSGSTLVSTNAIGNEGGEIQLAKSPNSSLSGTNIVIDQYIDRIRIFEAGGSSRGAYIDLTQAAAGVGTLLNNRVSGFVNAGTFVTMDLIKATVTTGGQRGLSLATTTGTLTYNIGGTFGGSAVGSGGSGASNQSLTTTATTSIFGWGFTATGDTATYILNDLTNSRAYRITLQIATSFNGNLISIERLV